MSVYLCAAVYDANQCYADKAAAYKVLYPAYGTYVGGETVTLFVPSSSFSSLIGMAFVIPGHIIGRINTAYVPEGGNMAGGVCGQYHPTQSP